MNWQRGDWVNIVYGFDRRDIYILSCQDGFVRWGMPTWTVSDSAVMTLEEFNRHDPIYLGRGKERLFRKLLPFFIRDSICPFTRSKEIENVL